MTSTAEAFEGVDAVARSIAEREHVPGIAYGVLRDGELIHAGGVGSLVVGEDLVPDEETVFRIASMSKSFTGAALMTLVDEGTVRLDDPVGTYVPEASTLRMATADAPVFTVRHLVSMESGLPTDDAWADRHLDMKPDELDALLATGLSFAWTPGISFEYANLAWAIVGRVIRNAAGESAQDLVRTRLLKPLGMASTAWTLEELPSRAVATGHRWEDEAWRTEVEPLGDGEMAPMGGLFSTVRDLTRWMNFFMDAFPPRDDADGGPLRRWARREMQQARRIDAIESERPRRGGPERTLAHGYGIGLGVTFDQRLGVHVSHSGGLPGFGSHMRWLPDRGLGLVALGNVTYAPMWSLCMEAVEVLADADALPPSRSIPPTDELAAACRRIASILDEWNDDQAASLFADNVALDDSFERRRDAARALKRRLGSLLPASELEAATPLRGTFGLADDRVKVEVELDAERPPRVQLCELDVEPPVIPHPPPDVAGTAYVVLRPAGVLAERFADLQAEVTKHIGGVSALKPAPHVTLKAFGTSERPVVENDVPSIADVVRAWSATTPPLRIRAEATDAFDDETVPVVRVAATPALRAALVDLRRRCADAALPAGYSDVHGADGWIFHLSLAYPVGLDDRRWRELTAWLRDQEVPGDESMVHAADLLMYDGGPERWIGRYPLRG
jgi:CubicO group peptidase (beta-lactamase class C family)/2'-5' RNA ligase